MILYYPFILKRIFIQDGNYNSQRQVLGVIRSMITKFIIRE